MLFKLSNLIHNNVKSDEIMHENSMTLIRLWYLNKKLNDFNLNKTILI